MKSFCLAQFRKSILELKDFKPLAKSKYLNATKYDFYYVAETELCNVAETEYFNVIKHEFYNVAETGNHLSQMLNFTTLGTSQQ